MAAMLSQPDLLEAWERAVESPAEPPPVAPCTIVPDPTEIPVLEPSHRASATRHLVERLKEADQDHEFYPTTQEIIECVRRDLVKLREDRYRDRFGSVLDIGAGNGKVLKALAGADTGITDLYAIEKSAILCQQLDSSILIVGTEFEHQTLFSKPVGIVFSNPPYSVFEAWCEKIIRQASCSYVYLVVPARWQHSQLIMDAMAWRGVTAKVLGDFDFEDAEDRTARAKVNVLRIRMPEGDDAFNRFFEQEFKELFDRFKGLGHDVDDDDPHKVEPPKEDPRAKFGHLVQSPNYPAALVEMYDAEMDKVRANYGMVAQLDADLLKEFDMNPQRIMECLKQRLKGMKLAYWQELFDHLDKITVRLTSRSRKKLLETLSKHTQVDFTYSNILAVVLWVINNANRYLESQLIETYEVMVEKANVRLYKSNKKLFEDQNWRYTRHEFREQCHHFALDYRIVSHAIGGVSSRLGWSKVELSEHAADFIGDLLTLANNLGFETVQDERQCLSYAGRSTWEPGELVTFHQKNGEPILDVRGYKNGNTHLRLNQRFMLALNVEHGRLKGWLRSAQEAVDELQDPEAAACWNVNHRIEINPLALLTA